MNTTRLYEILSLTTIQLRKGEVLEGTPALVEEARNLKPGDQLTQGGVLEININPPVSAARPDLELVDVVFEVIGVDKALAEEYRAELTAILDSYPDPERLAAGPSYIEVGGVIGDQGTAFQLFALGHVLGLWKVMTPASLGFTDPAEARNLAGNGFVFITGYRHA